MAVADVIRSQVVVDPPGRPRHRYRHHRFGNGRRHARLRPARLRRRLVVIEQGDFLPVERENWSFDAVHTRGYKNSAAWHDATGKDFVPGNYHYVGGSPKCMGPHCRDFANTTSARSNTSTAYRRPGQSATPTWSRFTAPQNTCSGCTPTKTRTPPIRGGPPTTHSRAGPRRRDGQTGRIRPAQGLHPFAAPQALDRRPGGNCVLCYTCDSFACMVDAKGDADVAPCARRCGRFEKRATADQRRSHPIGNRHRRAHVTAAQILITAAEFKCGPSVSWLPAVRSTQQHYCCGRSRRPTRRVWPTRQIRSGATTWRT